MSAARQSHRTSSDIPLPDADSPRVPVEEGSVFVHTIESIRLGEFDLGGVLYHANYFHLYEIVREACLSAHGVPYHALVERGEHLAVIRSHQEFLAPIRYGETVEIALSFTDLRRTSFTAQYEVRKPFAPDVIHRASTTHVFVRIEGDQFRPCRHPDDLVRMFSRFSVRPGPTA